jgi:hypothetical protein
MSMQMIRKLIGTTTLLILLLVVPLRTVMSQTPAFCRPTTGTIAQRFHSTHAGIDIASGTGAGVTPVYAAYAGRVVYRGTMNIGYSLAAAVAINHGEMSGKYVLTYYNHMGHGSMSYVVVNVGDSVYKGQLIGYQGDYPESLTNGVHLHFSVSEKDTPFLDAYHSWGTCATDDLWRELDGTGCPNPGTAVLINPEDSKYLGTLPSYITETCSSSGGQCCCQTRSMISTARQGAAFSSTFLVLTDVSVPFPTATQIPISLPIPEPTIAPTAFQSSPDVVQFDVSPLTSAHYRFSRTVFGSGGGPKTSESYIMQGTSGQTTGVDRRQSSSYVLQSGYWGEYWGEVTTLGVRVYLPVVLKEH